MQESESQSGIIKDLKNQFSHMSENETKNEIKKEVIEPSPRPDESLNEIFSHTMDEELKNNSDPVTFCRNIVRLMNNYIDKMNGKDGKA